MDTLLLSGTASQSPPITTTKMISYTYQTDFPESFSINVISNKQSYYTAQITPNKEVDESTIFDILDSFDLGDESGRLLAFKIASALNELEYSIPYTVLDLIISEIVFNKNMNLPVDYLGAFKLIKTIIEEHDDSN